MIIPVASAATINLGPGNIEHRIDSGTIIFQNTPTVAQAITFAPDGLPGQMYIFKFVTSGVTSYVTTFSTGFKTTATLASGTTTAITFTVSFISDGNQLVETARTAAQA